MWKRRLSGRYAAEGKSEGGKEFFIFCSDYVTEEGDKIQMWDLIPKGSIAEVRKV